MWLMTGAISDGLSLSPQAGNDDARYIKAFVAACAGAAGEALESSLILL